MLVVFIFVTEKREWKKNNSCTCPDSTQRFQLLHFKLRDTELSSCLFAPFLAECALLSVLRSLALISVCDSCWGARTFVYTCVWPMSSTAHPPGVCYLPGVQAGFSL